MLLDRPALPYSSSTVESTISSHTARVLIWILLIVYPLLTFQDILLPNAIDSPRRLALMLGTGLLVAVLFRAWALQKTISLRRHALDFPILLFAVAAIFTGISGEYPWVSFFGPVWSHDGLQVLGTCILLFFVVKEYLCTPHDIKRALQVMALTSGVFALIGIFDYLGIASVHLPSSGHRLIATMGNPMFSGTYLVMLIPICAGAALLTRNSRWAKVFSCCLILTLSALFFTLTRAAWLAFCGMIPLLLLLLWNFRHTINPLPSLRVVGRILLCCSLLSGIIYGVHETWHPDNSLKGRINSFEDLTDDSSVKERFVIMEGAWRMFLARPLQGWGIGNSNYVIPQYRPLAHLNRSHVRSQPHCVPLQILAETGLLGFIPYLLIIGYFFHSGWQTIRQRPEYSWITVSLICSFTAGLLSNLFNIDNAATMAQFWVTLALLAGLTAKIHPLPTCISQLSQRHATLLRSAGLVVGLLVVVHVTAQSLAGFYLYRAIDGLNRLEEVAQNHPKRAQKMSFNVLADTLRSIDLVPIPVSSKDGYIRHGDSLSWDVLSYTYRAQSRIFTDPVSIAGAHSLMRSAARRNLSQLDRDPIMGELLVEYMNFGEFTEARQLMGAVLRYSPTNAEVRLLNAQLYEIEGNIPAAIQSASKALELDSTFGKAELVLAHLIARRTEQDSSYAREAMAHFQQAEALKEPFTITDAREYSRMRQLAGADSNSKF